MMNFLLFADTPRFSNEGHRFLVPDGTSLRESLLGEFARAAVRAPIGANYIAATQRATQIFDNGTVRVGSELIVLAGLDVARLTPDQIGAVQGWLASKLEGLPLGDPGKPTTGLVIERPILNDWLEDPVLKHLAKIDWANGPRALQETRPGNVAGSDLLKWAVLAALVMAALAVLVHGRPSLLYQNGGPVLPPDPPKGSDQDKSQPKVPQDDPSRTRSRPATPQNKSHPEVPRDEANDLLNKLADRWGCEPSEVAASICRASDWKTKPDDFIDRVRREATSHEQFLKQLQDLASDSPSSLVAFLPGNDDEAKDLQELLTKPYSQRSLRLRKSLYETCRTYEKLRKLVQKLGQPFKDLEVEPSGFREDILSLAKRDPEPGLGGDGFVKPVTPIMERQDAMILRLLRQWLIDGHGLSKALRQANVVVSEDEALVSLLGRLNGSSEQIKEALEAERLKMFNQAKMVNNATAAQSNEHISTNYVREIYELTEQYIIKLSEIATTN